MTFVTFKICPLIACGIFKYLGGARFTGFSSRQCLNMKRPASTSSVRNSVETLAGFDSLKWQIARTHQLDSYERFIDVTLDPSCSRSTTFVDGRDTLHVRYKWR